MKKLAVVLLAASTLLSSANALAATSNNVLKAGSATTNGITALQESIGATADMPCFTTGCTIIFDVTELTTDKQLTLISYKNAKADELDNSVIQYINQYTIEDDTKEIKYTIRDTEDGIYKLVVNGSDGNNVTLYYKVANPETALVKGDGTDYYIADAGDVAFVGTITVDDAAVSLSDAGVTGVGFTIKDTATGKTGTKTEALKLSNSNIETNGSVTYVYGMELKDVPNTAVLTADAIKVQEAKEVK